MDQVKLSQPYNGESPVNFSVSRAFPTITNWAIASDHRPLMATFEAENK